MYAVPAHCPQTSLQREQWQTFTKMSASVCESHTHQKTCKKSLTCKDEEWRAISSATCHGTRYLSGALVVHGNRDEPLTFTWPNKKKGHGTALSISSLFCRLLPILNQCSRTLLGTGSRSFSPLPTRRMSSL